MNLNEIKFAKFKFLTNEIKYYQPTIDSKYISVFNDIKKEVNEKLHSEKQTVINQIFCEIRLYFTFNFFK